MPKNTRNVTFPVEQGMYERLQAFKKAPGLGEAARKALQYLIDHPNIVLKHEGQEEAEPEAKTIPTQGEMILQIREDCIRRLVASGYPELNTARHDAFYTFYVSESSITYPPDIVEAALKTVAIKYRQILEDRARQRYEEQKRKIQEEENRKKRELEEKAAQEQEFEALKARVLKAIQESRGSYGIGASSIDYKLGFLHDDAKLHRVLTELVSEKSIMTAGEADRYCSMPLPADLEAIFSLTELSSVYCTYDSIQQKVATALREPLPFAQLAVKMLMEKGKLTKSKDHMGEFYSKHTEDDEDDDKFE